MLIVLTGFFFMFNLSVNFYTDYYTTIQTQVLESASRIYVYNSQLKGVLDTFHTKRVLLDLVSKSLDGEGVSIYIGEESGYEALEACSVVAMPYEKEGQRVGVLGVVGPTRMPYEQVVSVVDVTSKLLSSALSD